MLSRSCPIMPSTVAMRLCVAQQQRAIAALARPGQQPPVRFGDAFQVKEALVGEAATQQRTFAAARAGCRAGRRGRQAPGQRSRWPGGSRRRAAVSRPRSRYSARKGSLRGSAGLAVMEGGLGGVVVGAVELDQSHRPRAGASADAGGRSCCRTLPGAQVWWLKSSRWSGRSIRNLRSSSISSPSSGSSVAAVSSSSRL